MAYDPQASTDHAERGPKRLLEQFRDKPKIVAMLQSYLRQVQKLENAAWEVINLRLLAGDIEGVQLDAIGKIVGQPRAGLPDYDYMIAIRGKIRINRSSGRPEDVIDVTRLSLPGVFHFIYQEIYPAAIYVSILEQVDFAITALFRNLIATKSGGVRLMLEYSADMAREWLTFADNTAIQDSDTNGFPDLARWNTLQTSAPPSTRFTVPFHPWVGGEAVTLQLRLSGTLPTPFALNTTYYIGVIDANTVTLAATSGGAPINYTTSDSSFRIVTSVVTPQSRSDLLFIGVGFQDIQCSIWPFFEGEPVKLTTTGELPGPYQVGAVYYVGFDDEDNMTLSATPFGAAITQTTVGSGTHTMTSILGGTTAAVLDSAGFTG